VFIISVSFSTPLLVLLFAGLRVLNPKKKLRGKSKHP